MTGRTVAREYAAWIFGGLLVLFLIAVFVFAPENLPPYKHRQLGFLCALLAGLFAYFFIGTTETVFRSDSPLVRFTFRGGGGASLFALVLLWWGSPYSLVGVESRLKGIQEDTGKLVQEQKTARARSLASLSPDLSAFKAYDYAVSALDKVSAEYDLIEVLGSYYICLEMPDRVFVRFPEWTLTFRHRLSRALVQYQVYDARVPRPPRFQVREAGADDILYFAILKKEYDDVQIRQSLASRTGERMEGDTHSVWFFDGRNLAYKGVSGVDVDHPIREARETDQFKMVARFQALGRRYENPPTEGLKIQSFSGDYEYRVDRSDLEPMDALDRLPSIPRNIWKVDAQAAVDLATAHGATATAPGKLNYPGILRLYRSADDGSGKLFWHLPYRLDLRYFVVDATTGEVYVIEGPHRFTRHESSR